MSLSSLILAVLFLLTPAAWAAPADDDVIALVGGSLIPVAGAEPVDDVVIVIRDGRIEAAGAGVEVPSDARAVDVTGLTLAPALVDAAHHADLDFPKHHVVQGDPIRDGRDTLAGMVDGNRLGLAPERDVTVALAPDGADMKAHREQGFGALLVAPDGMVLAGHGAWLAPNGRPARSAWLSGAVAQFGSLHWRGSRDYEGSSYPSTLMGVMAHLRQLLLDSQHHALVRARHAEGRSHRRPTTDPALMSLDALLEGRLPLVIEAREEEDIRLALGLVDDFPGLRVVIADGREAYELAEELAARNVGVLLDVDFPDEPDEPADDEDDEDDEASGLPALPDGGWPRPAPYDSELPPRLVADRHARWLDRLQGVQMLLDAGVPVAFASFDSKPADLVKHVRSLVEETDLSVEDALAAFTSGPRRVLGSSAPSGVIAVGEDAHLAAWSGSPLADKSEVELVVSDGRLFDLRDPAERRDPASNQEASDENVEQGAEDEPGDDATLDEEPLEVTEEADDGDAQEPRRDPVGTDGDEQDSDEGTAGTDDEPSDDEADDPEDDDDEPEVYAGPLARTPYEVALSAAQRAAGPTTWPVELDEDRTPATQTGGDVLLRGGTLYTITDGVMTDTDVLIRDGVIEAIGDGLTLPDGVTEIDCDGLHVMPGILDCHAHIAIRGGINEWTRNITPEVTIEDEVDPDDVGIYRALAGGTTSARLLHGSANAIGGRHEVIKLRWGEDAPGLVFDGAARGVKFALGENPRQANWGSGGRFPKTRMGVAGSLRRAFSEAQRYRDAWADHAAAEAAGEDPEPPRRDLRLEALVGIMDGEIPVHSHCYRAHEILMLIAVAEEFGFKVATFQHVLEGYKVAREIGAHGGLGTSTFIDWWGFKFEAYDAIPYNPALVHEAGVPMSINSDSGDHIRRLNFEAAKALKYGGVSEQDALAMVTLVPAMQVGVDGLVGSIEVGKQADLAIYSGHPFDTRSHVVTTLVDGEVRFERRDDVYAEWEAELATRIAAGRAALDELGELPARGAVASRNHDVDPAALAALALPDAGTAAPSTPARPAPRPVALVGGAVHTMDPELGVIDPGVVVLRDGLVSRVLAHDGSMSFEGYDVRDVSGSHVWPGMIDAGNTVGLGEIGAVVQSMDVREIGRDQADMRASTAWHPESETIPVARVNGVTSSLVTPAGSGIRGQSAVMAHEGWTVAEALVLDGAALHVGVPRVDRREDDALWLAEQADHDAAITDHCDSYLGHDESHAHAPDAILKAGAGKEGRGDDKLRGRIDEAWERLEQSFRDAREYARRSGAAHAGEGRPPAFDPRLEAMGPFALGQAPVHFHCSGADQIADALDFADREGLQAVIVGGRDAWKVAERLALADVPVLVGPVLGLPGARHDPYDANYANAGILHRAGVRIGFQTGSAHDARNLPYEAAMAVSFGLDEDAAMEALTAGNARILGLGETLGRLAPGLRADLFVTDGSPLQIRTEVRGVFIGGRDVGLDSKHTRLYEQYRERLLDPGRAHTR